MYNIKNELLRKAVIIDIATRILLCLALYLINFSMRQDDFLIVFPPALFWLVLDGAVIFFIVKGYGWARLVKAIYVLYHLLLLYYGFSTAYYSWRVVLRDVSMRYATIGLVVCLHVIASSHLLWLVYTNASVREDIAEEVQARKQKKLGSNNV